MTALAEFQFLHPLWLLALPLLWGLVWLFTRFDLRHSTWNRWCDAHLLERMRHSRADTVHRSSMTWILICLSTLAVLAAAGPSWRQQAATQFESTSARVIALDLSRDMLVKDVKPDRFAQAVTAVREIIGSDFDGETALVVFSGSAAVVSPLTRDSATLDAFVDSLEPGMMPLQGLRIDLAISRARDLLSASVTGGRQIVVVTSGSGDTPRAIEAAAEARSVGIQVSIMAIGTSAGGPRLEADGSLLRDAQGGYLLAKTGFADLRKIAAAGGGAMVSLTRATNLDLLLGSRIKAGILAADEPRAGGRGAANEGYWLVWLMLPPALVLFRRNLIWVLLAAVVLPAIDDARAAEPASIWTHRENLAYQAFHEGDFPRASELSADPLLRGAAYYRLGKHDLALQSFARGESASAHYNRGNALVQLNRLEEAVSAYGRALELDPNLAEARYNRQLVELLLDTEENSGDERAEDAAEESGAFESIQQSGSESLSGAAGEVSANPGDAQQPGPGLGASMQSGMADPFEEFSDGESPPEISTLMEYLEQPPVQGRVESWINELPVSSSDLLRRKFLRDYQRELRQNR
jgi:Ca-activated chloride channel family protein